MANRDTATMRHPLGSAMGWLGLGLGATQLWAPRQVADWLGLRKGQWLTRFIRACGAREAALGLGILSGRQPRRFLRARIPGDLISAALLGSALVKRRGYSLFTSKRRDWRLAGAVLGVAGFALLDVMALKLSRRSQRGKGALPKVAVAVTVDRSAADLYAFWRDVENLPRFISFLEAVTTTDKIRSHWRAKVPHGPTLEWDAAITEDRPDQKITWKMQSAHMAKMIESAEVRFEPAPGGRGTEVHLTLQAGPWDPARYLGHWLQRLPEHFWSAQLQRFKQLLELGEITVSDASPFVGPHPARPEKEELTSAPLASSAAPVPGPVVAEEGRPS